MKNKLHTTICHVERSRDISNKQKNIVYSFLLLLSSFFSNAQTYNWQWAMNGGGSDGGIGSGIYDEQIYDIKVGTDGNYYFIGTIEGNTNVKLNGQSQTVYNNTLGGNDIFIFSTTCDGTVR